VARQSSMIYSLVVLLLAVCVQGVRNVRHLAPTAPDLVEVETAEKTVNNVEFTFYGAGDNCPPGGDIAYPGIHQEAGGTGTFTDPITFAGTTKAMKSGTKIYIASLKKYFVLEDDCEECDEDWPKWHVDLWIGPLNATKGITDCEVALGNKYGKGTIIVYAASGKTVDTTPLWGTKCSVTVTDPCKDDGNECGNQCELPKSMSCASAAQLFGVTETRFKQLNPKINCNSNISSGKTVCQSGSCGGP